MNCCHHACQQLTLYLERWSKLWELSLLLVMKMERSTMHSYANYLSAHFQHSLFPVHSFRPFYYYPVVLRVEVLEANHFDYDSFALKTAHLIILT